MRGIQLLLAGLLSVVAFGTASAQYVQRSPAYDSLVARLNAGDTTVDFTALRLAYATTKAYNPYASATSRAMMKHRNVDSALAAARAALATNYVDIAAHAVAGYCLTTLRDSAAGRFHYAVRNGLILSVIRSGDGLSVATAMTVISTDEEYAVLAALGLTFEKQSLVEQDGRMFDRMEAVDRATGKHYALFFNVDLPMKRLNAMMNE